MTKKFCPFVNGVCVAEQCVFYMKWKNVKDSPFKAEGKTEACLASGSTVRIE